MAAKTVHFSALLFRIHQIRHKLDNSKRLPCAFGFSGYVHLFSVVTCVSQCKFPDYRITLENYALYRPIKGSKCSILFLQLVSHAMMLNEGARREKSKKNALNTWHCICSFETGNQRIETGVGQKPFVTC